MAAFRRWLLEVERGLFLPICNKFLTHFTSRQLGEREGKTYSTCTTCAHNLMALMALMALALASINHQK